VVYTEAVYFNVDDETRAYDTRFLSRDDLRAGHKLEGPTIAGEKDSTTIIPPDYRGTVTEYGDLKLVRGDY